MFACRTGNGNHLLLLIKSNFSILFLIFLLLLLLLNLHHVVTLHWWWWWWRYCWWLLLMMIFRLFVCLFVRMFVYLFIVYFLFFRFFSISLRRQPLMMMLNSMKNKKNVKHMKLIYKMVACKYKQAYTVFYVYMYVCDWVYVHTHTLQPNNVVRQ